MKVQTLRHTDVRGNELYYIKLTNSKGTEHLINVGKKTLEAVEKLNMEEIDHTLAKAEDFLNKGGKK